MMSFSVERHEFVFADERPFESCHASTLLVLPSGDVLVAWFGGTREGADDVAIWLSARRQGVWSAPVKVADEGPFPHWNPVLFRGKHGEIYLYYKIGKPITHWKTSFLVSHDEGMSWSEPRELVEGDLSGGRGPVKNKPIVLQDGTWAAPASYEEKLWDAFVDLSYDEGKTWERSQWVPLKRAEPAEPSAAPEQQEQPASANELPPVPPASLSGKGVIQPTLWESRPGRVHMLLRSSAGYVYRSDSDDSAKTWSEAYPTSLPNNNSGIDLVALTDGRLALVYNPVSQNWGPRTPLALSLSADNGATWPDTFVLEDTPGEYSYPAIVAEGNVAHITYTWKRERIVYWKITLA